MGLNGCCTTVKYLMVIVNLLFWILGLAIVICSIWMLTDPTFLFSMSEQNNHYIALYIFLAVGILMMIVAFLGCCGAFKESQGLLVSFFCLLLIVLVAEIAAGAWAFHNKDKLDEHVRTAVQYTVQEEYGQVTSKTIAFDTFQKQLQCCGADGPGDWASSKFNNIDRNDILSLAVSKVNPVYQIPLSCCREDVDKQTCELKRKLQLGAMLNSSINSQGCINKLVELVHDHWMILLGVTLAIILLEFFGLIFSLALCCTIRSQDHYKA